MSELADVFLAMPSSMKITATDAVTICRALDSLRERVERMEQADVCECNISDLPCPVHPAKRPADSGSGAETDDIGTQTMQAALDFMDDLRESDKPAPAATGAACQHEWKIDGAHSNEYCGKCYVDKPKPTESPAKPTESNSIGLPVWTQSIQFALSLLLKLRDERSPTPEYSRGVNGAMACLREHLADCQPIPPPGQPAEPPGQHPKNRDYLELAATVAAVLSDPENPASHAILALRLHRELGHGSEHWKSLIEKAVGQPHGDAAGLVERMADRLQWWLRDGGHGTHCECPLCIETRIVLADVAQAALAAYRAAVVTARPEPSGEPQESRS